MNYFGSIFRSPYMNRFYSSQSSSRELGDYVRERDYEQIRRIAIANMPKLVTMNPPYAKDEHLELFKSRIQPILENPNVFSKVIRCDGKTVGFMNYHVHSSNLFGRFARIEHMALESGYQKSGNGSKLMEYAINDLRSIKADVIHLNITEAKVIDFYKKFGFKVTKRPNTKHGSAGEMALLLSRSQGGMRVVDFFRIYKNVAMRFVTFVPVTAFAIAFYRDSIGYKGKK